MRISTSAPRRKPREGDTKTVRGVLYVRQQQRSQGGYVVRCGRPVFEWVRADDPRATEYRSGWEQPKRKPPMRRIV